MKYLGVDFGTKRVGLAISDDAGEFAFPKEIVATESAEKHIVKLCKEEKIAGIIIGQSLSTNERANELQERTDRLAKQLQVATGLSVLFENELFSSVEAHRYQINAGARDDSAAAIILQRFLDRKKK